MCDPLRRWETRTIAFRELLQALKRYGARLVGPIPPPRRTEPIEAIRKSAGPVPLGPLQRLVLTDEVERTLFAEYAEHRGGQRGEEETGWVLLGVRNADEAIALATLPAGAKRDAGFAHVRFNPIAQELASRVVRQANKQLTMLGVVHTHPGSLRHPSDGDYRGDIDWVSNLRGSEGIFGIGTHEASSSWQPGANGKRLGELCFSWYSLRVGDRNYRPLKIEAASGPDLALPLRSIWDELENHAERLDRLARQLTLVRFDVIEDADRPALGLTIPLADGLRSIRVLMQGKDVRYLLLGPDGAMQADFRDDCVDHGVFVMLAELAQ
ncbi:MAG: Mov34/MPN/PAD-1 family protein [Planctomycetes bacterium]|nr:Mov34/MPN/PAD-1 family protein [Planctomycetota bacterium]